MRFRESNVKSVKDKKPYYDPKRVEQMYRRFTCYFRVVDIIAEKLGIEVNLIGADTRITSDLGTDSLDRIEIIMAVEDEFAIKLPDFETDELGENCQIWRFCEFVENKVNGTSTK